MSRFARKWTSRCLTALKAKRIAQADQPRPSKATSLPRKWGERDIRSHRRAGWTVDPAGQRRLARSVKCCRSATDSAPVHVRCCPLMPGQSKSPAERQLHGAQRFQLWRNVLDGSTRVELISRSAAFETDRLGTWEMALVTSWLPLPCPNVTTPGPSRPVRREAAAECISGGGLILARVLATWNDVGVIAIQRPSALRKPLLYPSELLGHGSATLVPSLRVTPGSSGTL